jgi:rhodanese-related sulfurtransferase
MLFPPGRRIRTLAAVLSLLLVAGACSSGSDSVASTTDEMVAEATGIRLISAAEGEEIRTDPPEDLVILDVRTPEEFAEARLDGSVMLDFYEADFQTQLAELDPDVPYLLYCRSGNRSGQTAAMMKELGFTDVADVDGGIGAWADAGLPTISG